MKKITLNKDKNIGKVLFIVEGLSTEFYLLHRIFTKIFDYQFEKSDRMEKYRKYNEKEDILSSVFVINSEESAIKFVDDENEYLNKLFGKLIEEYKFPVDRAAIYYIFDRDVKSNTDRGHIESLIQQLSHARDSNGFSRQGLMLLSYPAIESFVASNFIENSVSLEFETGNELKAHLDEHKLNQSRIDEDTLKKAVEEMERAFHHMDINEYDLDEFGPTNLSIFHTQELHYDSHQKYKLLCLLSIVFLDLGMIEIEYV